MATKTKKEPSKTAKKTVKKSEQEKKRALKAPAKSKRSKELEEDREALLSLLALIRTQLAAILAGLTAVLQNNMPELLDD